MTSDQSALQLHEFCFVCGGSNLTGLQFGFEETEAGGAWGRGSLCKRFQGYKGLVHGGIIASILDAAMTNSLLFRDITALTAELNIRYRHPLHVDTEIIVNAWVVRERSPLYDLHACIVAADTVIATAVGRFYETET